jgi:3-hydroxyisobutyrate dehydrogenase/glyoxylate/succinic semialdehyde reductase
MQIGFIGLGIMGSRMAANLLKNNFNLTVYNRSKDKAAALLEKGASWAEDPAGVSRKSDVLFTMLSTPEVVAQTALGPDGFLDALRQDALWVDCSTVNPSFSKQMAAEARKRGVRFMDAPVSGSKVPAETGGLIFLVGGDPGDVKICEPFFTVMGSRVIHAGRQGSGAALKMVFNMLLGVSMLAFSEAMSLGQSLGLSQDLLLNALPGTPVAAPFIGLKKEKIKTRDFSPEFPLRWMQKDLHLATVSAYETGAALPLVSTAKEMFAMALRSGMGDKDISAVYELLNK